MELIPLGTSSATIVKERGLSAYALRHRGNVLLFDCGDGTQFRLLRAGIRRHRIRAVFISHLHGDHYLGLFGLLISMSLERRELPLTIAAPDKLSDIIHALPGLHPDQIHFPIEHVRLDEGSALEEVYQQHGLQVHAQPLDHGEFCLGYRAEGKDNPERIDGELARTLGVDRQEQFQRLAEGQTVEIASGQAISPEQVKRKTGSVFAYVTDTRPCQAGIDLARNADLLVHEATFSQQDSERASVTGHSTAFEAAQQAKIAGTKKLLLTHFSSRYPDVNLLREEAQAVFPNSDVAQEYCTYPVGSASVRSQPASSA